MTGAELRFQAAGLAGSAVLRSLGRTLRFRIEGDAPFRSLRAGGTPLIFAFWHSWILPLAFLHREEGVVVLVSRHGDGEYITRVVRRMGFETARGSSTRGGARGLRELVRAQREGRDIAFTPDGPRGPARVFKRGALVAAQLTGAPVVPVSVEAETVWRVGSWDRLAVPKPFGRFRVRYGDPHYVPREAPPHQLDDHARHLTERMNELEAAEVVR